MNKRSLQAIKNFILLKSNIPDFIIVGARKAGTTSLYNYLIKHPAIAEPVTKEIHYFDYYYNKLPLAWYKACFGNKKKWQIIGEATPEYLTNHYAAQRIHKLKPNMKIIILLRNPIDTSFSDWKMQVMKGNEYLNFHSAIKAEEERLRGEWSKVLRGEYSEKYMMYAYLSRSYYYEYIKKYYEYFDKKQILIIKSEDLFNNPEVIMKEVYAFLNQPYIQQEYQIFNKGFENSLSKGLRAEVSKLYKTYNKKLYNLINRDMDWD